MTRTLRLVAVAAVVILVAAGCRPAPPPGMSEAEHAIEAHFGPYGDHVVAQAKRVAWCESTWRPWATNGQYLGLFQMGRYHYWRFEGNAWDDPYVNARAAGGLWAEQGWRPWECKP